jgi:hypothetical protein
MTNRIFKIGQSREQGSFFPPRIEDYVAPDNPVRAIEAYVCALDLTGLGFRHAEGDGGAGQPPYDPADLLKLLAPRATTLCNPVQNKFLPSLFANPPYKSKANLNSASLPRAPARPYPAPPPSARPP